MGSLGEISQLKENKTTSPPQLQLKLAGFDKSLVGMVMNEQSRGREVRLMMVAISEEENRCLLKSYLSDKSHRLM